MCPMKEVRFIDNPAIMGRESNYTSIPVSVSKVLDSWRASLFSFEWVTPELEVRAIEELPEQEQEKRRQIEDSLRHGEPLEKPILGIGMLDNVEIGSGRAVFLTLAANGVEEIQVHVPLIHKDDFRQFINGADKSHEKKR